MRARALWWGKGEKEKFGKQVVFEGFWATRVTRVSHEVSGTRSRAEKRGTGDQRLHGARDALNSALNTTGINILRREPMSGGAECNLMRTCRLGNACGQLSARASRERAFCQRSELDRRMRGQMQDILADRRFVGPTRRAVARVALDVTPRAVWLCVFCASPVASPF